MRARARARSRHRASAPSRRCARGARARRSALYRSCSSTTRPTGRHYESLARRGGGRLPGARPRRARRGTCCWRCGRYAEAQRHFPVERAAARVGALRARSWAATARRRACSRRRATRRWRRSSWRRRAPRAAARLEWERVLRDERLAGRPYETALAHFNLGEALLRIGDRAGGLRELGTRGADAGGGRRRLRDPRRDASARSTATASCCGWARTRARSRPSPRAT